VAYWTDIFTLETWAQARARNFTVTGFPAPTAGRGGYSVSMFERVTLGDIFLCYCKSPAARWVGALRVGGAVFQSEEPIWGLAEDGSARYPWRFPVTPVIALEPIQGLPGEEAARELHSLRRLKRWGTFLQRSLNAVPDDDGQRLLELLHQPRVERPIVVAHRPTTRRPSEAPERGLLEAQAVLPFEGRSEVPVEAADREPRTHTEIQAKLRDVGFYEGFDVWVADRGLEWNGKRLGEGCLTDLPVIAADRTRVAMRGIDVIWFRKGAGHPVRFFEIEHSTTVYSGLLRFNDVMIDFPIPEAFIVGDGEKTHSKFEREIARRTFEHSGLRNVTQFLLYSQVRETWLQYQAVGRGSRGWGKTPRPAESA
jgi:hypothetical protein